MALKVNSTTIPTTGTIKYNGTSLTKVICNGTTVWENKAYICNGGSISTATALGGGLAVYQKCGFGWGWYDEADSDEYGICTITQNSSNIKFTGPSNKYGSIMSKKVINLSNYSKLYVVASDVYLYNSGGPRIGFATDNSYQFSGTWKTLSEKGTFSLDISSLTGNHYFVIAFQNKCYCTVTGIYLV